jgi:hypothetical protein
MSSDAMSSDAKSSDAMFSHRAIIPGCIDADNLEIVEALFAFAEGMAAHGRNGQ